MILPVKPATWESWEAFGRHTTKLLPTSGMSLANPDVLNKELILPANCFLSPSALADITVPQWFELLWFLINSSFLNSHILHKAYIHPVSERTTAVVSHDGREQDSWNPVTTINVRCHTWNHKRPYGGVSLR